MSANGSSVATGIRPAESDDVRAEAMARAAWSVLVEPGDGAAGTLIAELGAAEALRLVRDAREGRESRLPADAVARWAPRWDDDAFAAAGERARRAGAVLLVPGDAHWPVMLDDLGPHAPVCLWVRGETVTFTRQPQVAVVGARAATAYGEHVAGELAAALCASGVTIVSGGAYGIDAAAHRAAIASGGTTIAMLAGGVDRPYPAGHAGLFGRIAETGAVASEVPCGSTPTRWRFLSRNRTIAALGAATVVVEAGWRSGSLNTAGHAASLGRPVGAVPGPVTSAASAGCHRLLREYDAVCVTDAAEVRELIGPFEVAESESNEPGPSRGSRVQEALEIRTAKTPDELARETGMSIVEVRSELGMLGLSGAAESDEEGRWRRRRR